MKIKLVIIFFFFSIQILGQVNDKNYFANENIYQKPECVEFLVITNITDSITSVVLNLTNLQYLRIENEDTNAIVLPDEFYTLKKLPDLWLYGYFQVLSNRLGNLKELKQLRINNRTNKNIVPPAIKELQNLKSLEIYGIDTVIPEICELENLEYLLLYGTYSSLPDNIENLKSLKELRIMSPNLKKLPESFAELDSLEQLSFEFWEVETIPKEICKLKALKTLYFLFSEKITKFPRCLSKLPNIEKIMIYNSYTNKQKKRIYRLFKDNAVEIELF